MIGTVSRYLRFTETTSPNRKTSIVYVGSVRTGTMLGAIQWYGAWRCYAFYPSSDTLFNNECLDDIRRVITELMERRK